MIIIINYCVFFSLYNYTIIINIFYIVAHYKINFNFAYLGNNLQVKIKLPRKCIKKIIIYKLEKLSILYSHYEQSLHH